MLAASYLLKICTVRVPQTLSEDDWDYELQEYTSFKNKLNVVLE